MDRTGDSGGPWGVHEVEGVRSLTVKLEFDSAVVEAVEERSAPSCEFRRESQV